MKIKKMKKMNENLEELNGKPEDRIVIPEGQEYLGGSERPGRFHPTVGNDD